MAELARIQTPFSILLYEYSGPNDGLPVLLMHGFPYDIRGYDDAVDIINTAGFRTIVPYLRGYGPTRFLSSATIRSGQQAALGQDLLELMDALRIGKAVVAGYDWGGRAACIVSALWPERVHGLVSCTGYNIQDLDECGATIRSRAGSATVVSVLFPYRTWPQRPDPEPRRASQTALEDVVTQLGVRRRHIRALGVGLRQR